MADSKELIGFEIFSEPVKLGQECPQCGGGHWCDAICFRFAPRVFMCFGCGQYRKHRPMEKLIREYQMRKLLTPDP